MENIEDNKDIESSERKIPNLLEYAKTMNNKEYDAQNKIKIDKNNIQNIIIKAKNKVSTLKNILNDRNSSEKMNIIEESNRTVETNDSDNDIKQYFNTSLNINKIQLYNNKKNTSNNNNYKSRECNFIKINYLCKLHSKKFYAYCLDCNENICHYCSENTERHKDHNVSNYNKLLLNKFQEEEFKYRLCTSYISLKKLKEIILDICSNLIDLDEIILKNKVKKAYIKYYKKNLYQIEYAKLVYLRYILQKEISLINYQVLVNLYQIKFNNIKFPDPSIEIKERAIIIINFLSKTENYILLSSDSPHAHINFSTKIIQTLKNNMMNKNKQELNNVKKNNDNENIIKNPENESNAKDNKNNKIAKESIENKIINKETKIKNTISQTKITTTTSIFLSNSKIKSDSNKKTIGKKKEKLIKKTTKKIISSKLYNQEKKYKDISFNEYSTFIKDHPPLNDGIEVEFNKEIKFKYEDLIKNKIIYSIYQGECKKGTKIRHGRGFFKWSDGEKYIGYWVDDKREGKGINYYINGNLYEGMFKGGKKEGEGIYEWKNGDRYEGKWKNGVKEGEGTYYCSNGDIYKGSFLNDKLNGKGTYTWKNEDQYVGEFKNNYIVGVGFLYKNNKNGESKNDGDDIKIYKCEKNKVKLFK